MKLPSVVSFTQKFFVSRRRRVYVNPRCREMSRIFGIHYTCIYTNTFSPLDFKKTCWEKCFRTRILPSLHLYFCVGWGSVYFYSKIPRSFLAHNGGGCRAFGAPPTSKEYDWFSPLVFEKTCWEKCFEKHPLKDSLHLGLGKYGLSTRFSKDLLREKGEGRMHTTSRV